jgi:hypothetical protein
MCGVVKPPRDEGGPMHCGLPDQDTSEAQSALGIMRGWWMSGRRPSAAARGSRHPFSPADQTIIYKTRRATSKSCLASACADND